MRPDRQWHTVVASGDFILGIDFGGTKIALATATLGGQILRRETLDTKAPEGAPQAVSRALASATRLCTATEDATGGRCLGAGIASPGIIHGDHSALAPNVPGWERLDLPRLLRQGLGLDTIVCTNDVKAGGLAEARWGALRHADPGIFLSLGTGLAAALVIGGRVLLGAHGAAGEIGYQLRGPGDQGGCTWVGLHWRSTPRALAWPAEARPSWANRPRLPRCLPPPIPGCVR